MIDAHAERLCCGYDSRHFCCEVQDFTVNIVCAQARFEVGGTGTALSLLENFRKDELGLAPREGHQVGPGGLPMFRA